jgi:protein-S-isoprenylcysteine O-methyltransferase Ste14
MDPLFLTLMVIGFTITIIGVYIVVAWYSYWRKNFKGKLLTDGPYAKVRHPYYLGFLILITGLVVLIKVPEIIVLAFLSWIFIVVYIKKEEDNLIKKYGKKYLEYVEKVPWRLLPYIY